MAKKLTKEDLKLQGVLHNIALGFASFYQKNKKIVISFVAILVLGIVFFKVVYDKKQDSLVKGFKALYVPMSIQEQIAELDNTDAAQAEETEEVNIDELKSQIQIEYDKILSDKHPDQVMIVSALNLAEIHRKNGDIDKAISAFSNVNLNGKDFLSGLGAMTLASLYEETSDCSRAIELWDGVIKTFSFFRNSALLKKALCLEDKHKAQAMDIYTKLSVDSPETPEGDLAKKLLMIKGREQ